MNVRCWNCGQDHEVTEDAIRLNERMRIIELIEREALLSGTCGDIYRHNALMSATDLIKYL